METYEPVWTRVAGSQETPVMGFRFQVGVEPLEVNVERMVNHFRNGVVNLMDVWAAVLAEEDLGRLRAVASLTTDSFELGDDLWVRLVCDFAAAFHHRVMDRQHLVRSFLPLYMGRVASFVREMALDDAAAVEEKLERLCLAFESAKPYLIERWGAPRPQGRTAVDAPDRSLKG
jgi:hypothetical protein